MKKSGWIILLCFFLIVFVTCYFIFSTYQKSIEGLRTVPLPTRQPQPTEYKSRPKPTASGGGMNNIIDSIIDQFFDKNRLPYQNTIDLFESYAVNKGNVSKQTLYKLMDICYYMWDIVLPNIQTIDNPKPSLSWPKIQWVSNKWLTLDQTYNTIRLNKNAMSYFNVDEVKNRLLKSASSPNPEEKTIQVSNIDRMRLDGLSYDSSFDSSTTTSNSSSKNCTIGGSCEIQCPTSCMSNQFTQENTQEGSLNRDKGNIDETTDVFGLNYLQRMAKSFMAGMLTDHLATDQIFQPVYGNNTATFGYYVTNRPQTSNSEELEKMIQQQINELFEPSGAPTPNLLKWFDYYTRAQSPADDVHIKKLRHLIYYFMQRIIPGLPTNERPITYVIWKPFTN